MFVCPVCILARFPYYEPLLTQFTRMHARQRFEFNSRDHVRMVIDCIGKSYTILASFPGLHRSYRRLQYE